MHNSSDDHGACMSSYDACHVDVAAVNGTKCITTAASDADQGHGACVFKHPQAFA